MAEFGWGSSLGGPAVLRYPKNIARLPEVLPSILPDETGKMTLGKKPPNQNHRTCLLWGQKSTLSSMFSHSLALGTLSLLSAWPFFPFKCEVGREHGGNSNSLLLSCQVKSWRMSIGTHSPTATAAVPNGKCLTQSQ